MPCCQNPMMSVRIGVVVPDTAGEIIRMGACKANYVVAEGMLPAVLRCMQPQHRALRCLGTILQGAQHAEHGGDANSWRGS